MCKADGIEVNFRGNCPNCYADALVLLARHYGVNSGDGEVVSAGSGRYRYLKQHFTLWKDGKNVRRLDENSSDEDIEAFRAAKPSLFPLFFVDLEEQRAAAERESQEAEKDTTEEGGESEVADE